MPTVLKQTTKQAKAAFKARGRPCLTEKEQRQLERSIELEQRAEKVKDGEKRRAEAAKKRSDNAGRERLGLGSSALLGSQRRCDRFGYKSSQFHLGAFFGKRAAAALSHKRSAIEDDAFSDHDLDDDSLLGALHGQSMANTTSNSPASIMMPPPAPPSRREPAHIQPKRVMHPPEDFASFFDDLDSSTQIARELDAGDQTIEPEAHIPAIRNGSFSSGSLDLTTEDLEALDPPKLAPASMPSGTRMAMPPPALSAMHQQSKPAARPTPHAATRTFQNQAKHMTPDALNRPLLPASSLYRCPDFGFTSTQLESFIDDDIQLTQMAA